MGGRDRPLASFRREEPMLDIADVVLLSGVGLAATGAWLLFGWPAAAVTVGVVMIGLAIARAVRGTE